MDSPWTIVLAVLTLMLSAPVMNLLGQWLAVKVGLREKREQRTQDIAERVREEEMEARLEWQRQQARELDSSRLRIRTMEDAHRDLERRYDALERELRTVTEQVARQQADLTTLRAENEKKGSEIVVLRNRILELEAENYRLHQEIKTLKRSTS